MKERTAILRFKDSPASWNRGPCLAASCRHPAAAGNLCVTHQRSVLTDARSDIDAAGSDFQIERVAVSRGYVLARGGAIAPGKQILVHRIVAALPLGRWLHGSENVHHINGITYDNHPDNLELWCRSQPAGQRPGDLVRHARQILARYGDEDERTFYQGAGL